MTSTTGVRPRGLEASEAVASSGISSSSQAVARSFWAPTAPSAISMPLVRRSACGRRTILRGPIRRSGSASALRLKR